MTGCWDTQRKKAKTDECRFCRMTEEEHQEERNAPLEVHHVVPRRADGTHARRNLITVCHSCHITLERTQARGLAQLKEELEERIDEIESDKGDDPSNDVNIEVNQDPSSDMTEDDIRGIVQDEIESIVHPNARWW